MTNETLTQDHFSNTKEIPKKLLNQHEQFCLGVLGVVQNGATIEELMPLIEKIHDQSAQLACK